MVLPGSGDLPLQYGQLGFSTFYTECSLEECRVVHLARDKLALLHVVADLND